MPKPLHESNLTANKESRESREMWLQQTTACIVSMAWSYSGPCLSAERDMNHHRHIPPAVNNKSFVQNPEHKYTAHRQHQQPGTHTHHVLGYQQAATQNYPLIKLPKAFG